MLFVDELHFVRDVVRADFSSLIHIDSLGVLADMEIPNTVERISEAVDRLVCTCKAKKTSHCQGLWLEERTSLHFIIIIIGQL